MIQLKQVTNEVSNRIINTHTEKRTNQIPHTRYLEKMEKWEELLECVSPGMARTTPVQSIKKNSSRDKIHIIHLWFTQI